MDFTRPWDLGDVTLIVEGKKIHVNKGVLVMSSEVFKTMFTADFKEKKMTEIPLPDKKFDDFLIFMQIIHPLPKICVDDTNVERLLPLAHEYQIQQLIERCEKVLVKQPPSIHNLILSDKFSLPALRKVFLAHLKEVAYTKLKSDPEFELVDKATRTEVFERHAMLQQPSIKNLFLAEKYNVHAVYEKCLKYLKDTPLIKLKSEAGFTQLKPATLIKVLTFKVEKLEQLETLKVEVRDLTNYGRLSKNAYCSEPLCQSGRHIKGSNPTCYHCLQDRIMEIGNVIKRY